MGLETATLIKDLVATNPQPSDKRRFGDDHLRLIKGVLQNQFPNVQEQVTVSEVEINYLANVQSLVQTQLDNKLESADLDLTPYAEKDVRNTWEVVQQHVPVDLGNTSGVVNADMSLSTAYTLTMTDDTILTWSGLSDGQEVTLKVVQGASPPATLSLPITAHFPYKVQPVASQNVGEYDIYAGKVIDGVVVFGFLANLGVPSV